MIYLILIGLLLTTMIAASILALVKIGEKEGICKYGYKDE